MDRAAEVVLIGREPLTVHCDVDRVPQGWRAPSNKSEKARLEPARARLVAMERSLTQTAPLHWTDDELS